MTEPVVVLGGGQAGLAVSHHLNALGIEHAILERDRVASAWRGRWGTSAASIGVSCRIGAIDATA